MEIQIGIEVIAIELLDRRNVFRPSSNHCGDYYSSQKSVYGLGANISMELLVGHGVPLSETLNQLSRVLMKESLSLSKWPSRHCSGC